MAFKPNHFALIILNQDGSGSIKQYTDYQEAKAAYQSFTDSGNTVWLYPQPMSSLTQSTTPPLQFTPPVAQEVSFTPEDNRALPSMAPVVNPQFSNNAPTYPPDGDIVSSVCASLSQYYAALNAPYEPYFDKVGVNWTSSAYIIRLEAIADGNGGIKEYRTLFAEGGGGCYYPNDFAVEEINSGAYYNNIIDPTARTTVVITSYIQGLNNDPTMSCGPIALINVLLDGWSDITVANGAGGTKPKRIYGLPNMHSSGNIESLFDYADTGSPNDWLLDVRLRTNRSPRDYSELTYGVTARYASDEHGGVLSEGKWFGRFKNYGAIQAPGARAVEMQIWWEPLNATISARDTIPLPGRVGRAINLSQDGEDYDIDSSEVVPVSKIEHEVSTREISVEGEMMVAGHTWYSTIISRYTYTSPPAFEWYPYGTTIGTIDGVTYASDGEGSYYAIGEPPPPPDCDPEGTPYGSGDTDIIIEPGFDGVSELLVGSRHDEDVADGNCGTTVNTTYEYVSAGTLLASGEVYDFYSDGNGGYTIEERGGGGGGFPPEGEIIGTELVGELNDIWTVGYRSYDKIANGSGGYTVSGFESGFEYKPVDTLLGRLDGYDYFSDGVGGWYNSIHEGDDCEASNQHDGEPLWQWDGCLWTHYPVQLPAYGVLLKTENIPYVIDFGCGEWNTGNRLHKVYANGTGGIYETNLNTFVPINTHLGVCETTNYYADGAGGYYVECAGAGAVISSDGPYDITWNETACGDFIIGSYYNNEVTDGNCGSYTEAFNSYNVGDVGTCDGLIYSVDEAGLVTSRGANCEDAGLHEDGVDGWTYDGCNWFYSETPCPPADQFDHFDTVANPTIPVSDCSVTEIVFADFADLDFYTDGSCGTYTDNIWYNMVNELPDETAVGGYDNGECSDYCWVTYRSSGSGISGTGQPSYTYNSGSNDSGNCGPTCDPADTFIETYNTPAPTIPWTTDYTSGDFVYAASVDANVFADGNCGTYETLIFPANDEFPTGEVIIDFDGGCDSYRVLVTYIASMDNVDGYPTYTIADQYSSGPCCDQNGTDYGVDPNDGCFNIYADGNCGTYTSDNGSCTGGNCDPPDIFDHTDGCNDYYTDGACGLYAVDNGSCLCPESGTWVSSDECNDYYNDGVCGIYSSDNGMCGGGCTGDGEVISSGNISDLMITIPCGEVYAGERVYDVVHDGACGTREVTTSETWYPEGSLLGACMEGELDCAYYSDGIGSYTTECFPPYNPNECEDSEAHIEGEDGWTYDGCHWLQDAMGCYSPNVGPNAMPDETSDQTDETFNILYNEDGSIYAIHDGNSWVIQ
jgi:hypothetical protein